MAASRLSCFLHVVGFTTSQSQKRAIRWTAVQKCRMLYVIALLAKASKRHKGSTATPMNSKPMRAAKGSTQLHCTHLVSKWCSMLLLSMFDLFLGSISSFDDCGHIEKHRSGYRCRVRRRSMCEYTDRVVVAYRTRLLLRSWASRWRRASAACPTPRRAP